MPLSKQRAGPALVDKETKPEVTLVKEDKMENKLRKKTGVEREDYSREARLAD